MGDGNLLGAVEPQRSAGVLDLDAPGGHATISCGRVRRCGQESRVDGCRRLGARGSKSALSDRMVLGRKLELNYISLGSRDVRGRVHEHIVSTDGHYLSSAKDGEGGRGKGKGSGETHFATRRIRREDERKECKVLTLGRGEECEKKPRLAEWVEEK